MPSTPKHMFMYEAFGWQAPAYAHVGLLLDQQGQKLSKRNHDTGIDSFRKNGIFPETLNNFVALLGWSHSLESDKLGPAQLIEHVRAIQILGLNEILIGSSLTSNSRKAIPLLISRS